MGEILLHDAMVLQSQCSMSGREAEVIAHILNPFRIGCHLGPLLEFASDVVRLRDTRKLAIRRTARSESCSHYSDDKRQRSSDFRYLLVVISDAQSFGLR